MHINRTHDSIQLVFSCSLITTVKGMAFISNLIVYLTLFQYLQVVEAPAQNISAGAVTKSVEVKLVSMDQGLCDYIEPLVWPRIVVIFVFNTPKMTCTPCQTTLAKLIDSSNKTLSYSHDNTKCSLRKKEGMIEETNSTTTAPPYVVIVLVNNTFPSERNKPNKKDLLYQKVRDTITQSMYNFIVIFLVQTKDCIMEHCTGVSFRRKHRNAYPATPYNLSHATLPKHMFWSLQPQ